MQLIPSPLFQTGQTDDFSACATEMANVHNCIIRAFNSIYIQAPHIPAAEHKNFIAYMTATWQGLEAHHDGEEDFFFPEIERLSGEKGLMDGNVKQHEAFHSGFHAWGEWLASLREGKEEYSGAKCRALLDAFVTPLSVHLADEIPSLLSLAKYGSEKLPIRRLMEAEGEKVMGSMSKTAQLPMFWSNHDTTYEGGMHNFPPIPAPVKWVLREVCGRWNSEWWKFGTVDFSGMPRELKYIA
jgi:hemerythrin-like domain-containing protein